MENAVETIRAQKDSHAQQTQYFLSQETQTWERTHQPFLRINFQYYKYEVIMKKNKQKEPQNTYLLFAPFFMREPQPHMQLLELALQRREETWMMENEMFELLIIHVLVNFDFHLQGRPLLLTSSIFRGIFNDSMVFGLSSRNFFFTRKVVDET